MPSTPHIERLPKARVKAILTFSQEESAHAEETTLQRFAVSLTLPGFRTGHAPAHLVKEHVGQNRLFEETLRTLLLEAIPTLIREHTLKPILPPHVEAKSREPLTVAITFVLRPTVTVRELNRGAFARKETGLGTREEHLGELERKRALLEELRRATSVELAPELLDAEVDDLLHTFTEELRRQNLTFEQWRTQVQKDVKELREELLRRAAERLTVRFGLLKLMEERKVHVTDADVRPVVEQMRLRATYTPGSPPFEELRWRMQVEKLFAELLR